MSDTLVLAEITIDAKGVISGVAAVDSAFDKVGRRVNEFGTTTAKTHGPIDALNHKLFSMREAASALLGGVGIAGLILAFKDFAIGALKANENFGTLAASWTKFTTDLEKTAGNFPAVNQGLQETSDWLDRIDRILVRMQGRQQSGANPLSMFTGLGLLLDRLGAKFDEKFPKIPEAFGPPAPPNYGNAGYDPDKVAQMFGPPGKQGWGDLKGAFYDKNGRLVVPSPATRMDEIGGPLSHAWPEIPDDDALDRWNKALELQDQQNQAIADGALNFDRYAASIDSASAAYEKFGLIAQAASAAISAAAASGVISQKAATKAMLALEAVHAIMQGKIEAAKAIAAAAAQHYGEAALHGVAAGLFFAAAAFNAAGAINSGAAGGYGGAGGIGAPPGGPGSIYGEPARIVVINEGTMIGNTPDQIVRWITEAQRRSGER